MQCHNLTVFSGQNYFSCYSSYLFIRLTAETTTDFFAQPCFVCWHGCSFRRSIRILVLGNKISQAEHHLVPVMAKYCNSRFFCKGAFGISEVTDCSWMGLVLLWQWLFSFLLALKLLTSPSEVHCFSCIMKEIQYFASQMLSQCLMTWG